MQVNTSIASIMAAIARGQINEAISTLQEYADHLTDQDKLDLLHLLQLQNYV